MNCPDTDNECIQVDIAPTISKILHIPMIAPSGKPIQKILDYTGKKKCRKIVLIIVDSLGFSLYKRLEKHMPAIKKIADTGLLIKCRSVADKTTPAIASIFSGYYPEEHMIQKTEDLYYERVKNKDNPKIKSILEWAHEAGLRSSIAIESEGAAALSGRIDTSSGVRDVSDIVEYDRKITEAVFKSLKNQPHLMAIHLRTIDRIAHTEDKWKSIIGAASCINKNIDMIINEMEPCTLVIVCGDHPIHSSQKWLKMASDEEINNYDNKYVALIAGCI
ncbi:type I phosphodiesterase/nucleotide pyrophosphatase [Methanosalsum zhilinae DSM 4017]|uniref:Type I phosphodiesterase/nucleotide pyrophosphatase n=1 Tax=Methanosalsum zhilinae (strain DSM 4017 / NBRC 107636 / OCM 62 / WeN5) TaxID=679901 RepID=F7XLM8_METZD|nr:alkaline phosphatase family protein [Methanosalsum zhilinae]AEH60851.1 type I phosphodiesterase/nucleotide pyrophosphatase [Methanosalsum zhilinae DSM 4017]